MPDCTLTFENIALHEGKAFAQICCKADSAAHVQVASTLDNGATVPIELFSPDGEAQVVATPWLTKAQTLTAVARDAQGAELSGASLSLDPASPPQQSTSAPDYPAISQRLAPFVVAIKRIVSTGDEALVTCVVESFPYRAEHDVLPGVEVLSLDGTPIPIRLVDLGTASRPDLRYPAERRYLSTVSFRVSNSLAAFAISVTLGDGCRTVVLNDEQVSNTKNGSYLSTLPANRDPRYHDWYHIHHKANETDLYLQRCAIGNFAIKPVYSIIVPLYQTPLDFFHEMANSVLAQTYPHFELLLVNASPKDPKLRHAVEDLCAKDARVRHLPLAQNLGITENTNEGIRAATGDFVAFLDHDDVVEPDLLYCYTKAVNDYPTTDLLYCDEDRLENGRFIDPFFKPDWDPDLLCAENYVCHLLCVRKSVVDAFDELPTRRFDGAQDHNMAFLVGEQARNVYHVRRILYHWRIHEHSTAGKGATADEKPYALEAERLAIQNHLDRCGIDATAVMERRRAQRCDVVYHIKDHPLVSIVIPNKDALHLLKPCVDSVLTKSTWPKLEVVIVENNSTKAETFAYYDQIARQDARVRVVTSQTGGVFNFSKVVNDGFAAAKGDYLLMLNNDTEVIDPDWIEQMMGPCMRKEIGAVGCKLLYPDNTYQHVGIALGRTAFGPRHIDLTLCDDNPGYYECDELTHRVCAVTGACILTKREVFELVDGLDETLPNNFNDIDYCMRLREKGYATLVVLTARLYHYESATRPMRVNTKNSSGVTRDYGIFMCRWQKYLTLGEPYYNQNFRGDNAYHALEL